MISYYRCLSLLFPPSPFALSPFPVFCHTSSINLRGKQRHIAGTNVVHSLDRKLVKAPLKYIGKRERVDCYVCGKQFHRRHRVVILIKINYFKKSRKIKKIIKNFKKECEPGCVGSTNSQHSFCGDRYAPRAFFQCTNS
jgi:hypothetical protein